MRPRRIWPGVVAVTAVVAVVAALLIITKPFDKSSSSPAIAAAHTSGVSATISLRGRTVKTSPGVSPQVPAAGAKYFQPDSQTVSITPSGPLAKHAVVKLRLNRPPQPGEVAAILTSESPNGPWQILPGTVIDGGRYVEATVTHLSFFSAAVVDWRALLNDLQGAWNSFTDGAYSNASTPPCGNKSEATQDGYSVTPSMKDNTVLWCYGVENGQRVLKIVDNRRYPLLVAHGLPLTGGSSSGDVFQRAASLLNLGDALVYPQDEADFAGTVEPGHWSALAGNYAPVAGYLASLSIGVQAWLAIVTRGHSAENPSKVMDTVDQLLTLDTCRAAAMGGNAADIQGSCFTPDMFGKLFGAFWGYMLSIVQTVSEFANWFRSTLNTFADSIDGRSSFEITVKHAATADAQAACTAQALAKPAHAYVAAHGEPVDVNEIATHACDQGYAEIIVDTSPSDGPPYEWSMAFHAVSGNWQVIGSSDYIPPGSFGMPTDVGQALNKALQANEGGNEHVTF